MYKSTLYKEKTNFNRQARRRSAIIAFMTLIIIICLFFSQTNLVSAAKKNKNDAYMTNEAVSAPFEINCNSYVLMDLDSGQILYEKNADKKVYPASTTKIMTSILALETLQDDSIVTVSQEAIDGIGPGGMNIGCIAGEEFKFKDIIKAVLLTSANECANAIAENSAGTHDEFIEWMNAKAKEIGANSTNYVNAHGMFDENHYTTARNLAAIARYAMVLSPASSKFRNIVKQETYNLKPTNKHSEWYPYALPITNKLRDYPSEYYDKVLGVKTGYILKSGMNFVSAVKDKNGRRLLSVICGVDPSSAISVFKYTQMLLDEGYKNYTEKKIVDKTNKYDTLSVENLSGIKNDVPVAANGSVRAFFEKGDDSADGKVTITKEYRTDISVPLKKGDVVGTMTASYNGQVLGSLDILVEEDVPYDYSGYIRTILIIYLILALLFGGGLVILGFMSKSRRPLQPHTADSSGSRDSISRRPVSRSSNSRGSNSRDSVSDGSVSCDAARDAAVSRRPVHRGSVSVDARSKSKGRPSLTAAERANERIKARAAQRNQTTNRNSDV